MENFLKLIMTLVLIISGSTSMYPYRETKHVEHDGFEWVKIFDDSDGISMGAKTIDGEWIIPMAVQIILYSDSDDPYSYFNVHKQLDSDNWTDMIYALNGDVVYKGGKYRTIFYSEERKCFVGCGEYEYENIYNIDYSKIKRYKKPSCKILSHEQQDANYKFTYNCYYEANVEDLPKANLVIPNCAFWYYTVYIDLDNQNVSLTECTGDFDENHHFNSNTETKLIGQIIDTSTSDPDLIQVLARKDGKNVEILIMNEGTLDIIFYDKNGNGEKIKEFKSEDLDGPKDIFDIHYKVIKDKLQSRQSKPTFGLATNTETENAYHMQF